MGVKAALSLPFARFVAKKIRRWSKDPIAAQDRVFQKLIQGASKTSFGRDHSFSDIHSYEDFKKNVPIVDYEQLRPYIDRIIAGEQNILWPGAPIYFCKTSGTTSGTKYIPITRDSIKNQIGSARNALLSYIAETGHASFVNGKMIFLQGSPTLDKIGPIPLGRLSGIVANHVPSYLLKNRMPSFKTNCIEDWETKLDAIVEETIDQDMTLISGIPSWVQMYYERLLAKSGKENISEIFPNYSLFVHGGVNYQPYAEGFDKLVGKKLPTIETYPASEGFIAFQDSQKEEGLLLVANNGIFYEFIPAAEFHDENPTRLSLKDVEIGVNYVLILNTNAGLWGYNIGDTVKFVSTYPHRIVVTGRIKHFTSAFGEHVIAEEVEGTMSAMSAKFGAEITEFHVAPVINPENGLPYHQWLVEFAKDPADLPGMIGEMDALMQEKNVYYKDLIVGNVLKPLVITPVQKGGFVNYMKSIGKLGGQNKVPRLSNDRNVADSLENWKI